MKKLFFLIMLIFIFNNLKVSGNSIFKSWNEGILVLKNQQIIKGEITYNSKFDVVQIKVNDKIKTFSPYSVTYFQVFDEDLERSRIFAAVDFNQELKSMNREKTFLEVLINGQLLFLQKEEIKELPVQNIISDISFTSAVEYSNYVYANEQIIKIKNFKKDILPLMADEAELIASYIKSRNMDLQQIEHQALIIDYYNYLKDPFRPTLRDQEVAQN